ncbi:MAG TPA: fructose-6-phosphate aldolase, partial [Marivita sp.]|nr:fructose-6-phosphate aldolase [Marivita sp.]
ANHMSDCAKIGADVATAPPGVIKAMANHLLTDKGLEQFVKDAAAANIKIV